MILSKSYSEHSEHAEKTQQAEQVMNSSGTDESLIEGECLSQTRVRAANTVDSPRYQIFILICIVLDIIVITLEVLFQYKIVKCDIISHEKYYKTCEIYTGYYDDGSVTAVACDTDNMRHMCCIHVLWLIQNVRFCVWRVCYLWWEDEVPKFLLHMISYSILGVFLFECSVLLSIYQKNYFWLCGLMVLL